MTRFGTFQSGERPRWAPTPCPASGVWIRAASAQLPLRWGRFFATYGNERGRQLRRPYSAGLGLRFSGLGLRAFNSSNRRLHLLILFPISALLSLLFFIASLPTPSTTLAPPR